MIDSLITAPTVDRDFLAQMSARSSQRQVEDVISDTAREDIPRIQKNRSGTRRRRSRSRSLSRNKRSRSSITRKAPKLSRGKKE